MRKTWILALTTLCLSFSAFAQQNDSPKPDRWRGLVLNESAPEDAIKAFGQPKKDREGGLRTYPLNKRLSVDHNTKGLRKLRYEKLDGVDEVELIFKDGKLVIIELHLKEGVPAGNLSRLYDAEFEPKFKGINLALESENYERHKGRKYPENFPDTYYLIAYTDKSIVSAFVEQSMVKNFLLGSRRDQVGDDDRGGFPGKTKVIQIISRTLENREGADVLK